MKGDNLVPDDVVTGLEAGGNGESGSAVVGCEWIVSSKLSHDYHILQRTDHLIRSPNTRSGAAIDETTLSDLEPRQTRLVDGSERAANGGHVCNNRAVVRFCSKVNI